MSTRTIDGKRMTQAGFDKRFRDRIRKLLGPAYPICDYDWNDARYSFNIGTSPVVTAEAVAGRRKGQMIHNAHRTICKYWTDEFDGEFRVGPGSVPPAVVETIKGAVANGCRHGTVTHWTPRIHQYTQTGDVQPEIYCWESLA